MKQPPNPSIERTSTSRLRLLAAAAHVKRWGAGKASQRFPIEPMTTQAPDRRPLRQVPWLRKCSRPPWLAEWQFPSAIGYRSVHGLRSPAPLVSPWPVEPVTSPSLGGIGQAHAPTVRCSRRRETPSLFQAFVAGAADLVSLGRMSQLTPLEQQVLDMFLVGDHPALEALRAQRAAATIASRDYTGVGVYVYFSVPDSPPRTDPPDMVFGDVNLELSNAEPGVAALLFVEAGQLRCLEFVTASGPWPTVPVVRSSAI